MVIPYYLAECRYFLTILNYPAHITTWLLILCASVRFQHLASKCNALSLLITNGPQLSRFKHLKARINCGLFYALCKTPCLITSAFVSSLVSLSPWVCASALIWVYLETGDIAKISVLAANIFWFVLPSLAFFITLPILLKMGLHFYWSLSLSVCVTVFCYYAMLLALKLLGIEL